MNAIYRKNSSRDDRDVHRKSIVKEEAKRAADQVLGTIHMEAVDPTTGGNTWTSAGSNPVTGAVTTSGSSADSVGSTEIAIERGSMRALSESNEHVIHRYINNNNNNSRRNLSLHHLSDLDSHQSPTVTTAGLDFDLATAFRTHRFSIRARRQFSFRKAPRSHEEHTKQTK